MTKEEFIEKWHPTVTDTNGTHKMVCSFEEDLNSIIKDNNEKYINGLAKIATTLMNQVEIIKSEQNENI